MPGGGGGHSHTWEYWGCAAGQGAFLSFQLWHRVYFSHFRNWDRVFFWASNFGHSLSMYFADFSGHYQPNSIALVLKLQDIHKTLDVDPVLVQCWSGSSDVGPTLNQQRLNTVITCTCLRQSSNTTFLRTFRWRKNTTSVQSWHPHSLSFRNNGVFSEKLYMIYM